MSQRVSEATLMFTRNFWETKKFEDIQVAEGDTFIQGREHMCREISPQNVIVSLVHSKNTSSRRIPEMKEPNGCHYGFNEQLFAMVSQIGEELKTTCGSSSQSCDDGDRPQELPQQEQGREKSQEPLLPHP
jgi:hypothetical protein